MLLDQIKVETGAKSTDYMSAGASMVQSACEFDFPLGFLQPRKTIQLRCTCLNGRRECFDTAMRAKQHDFDMPWFDCGK